MADTTQNPQPIIDLIMADINAVIPNLTSLITSYRLLVGASEEIHRTPDICPDVFERAVRRADNAGSVIDMFLELLCYKLEFSSDFLKVSCAPVDLFRLLANPTTTTDIPHHTAEQVVEMEALRRLIDNCCCQCSCLPKHSVVVCPKHKPPLPKTQETPEVPESDIQEVEASLLTNLQSEISANRELPIESRVRRKHLRDVYDPPPSKPRKR